MRGSSNPSYIRCALSNFSCQKVTKNENTDFQKQMQIAYTKGSLWWTICTSYCYTLYFQFSSYMGNHNILHLIKCFFSFKEKISMFSHFIGDKYLLFLHQNHFLKLNGKQIAQQIINMVSV